MECLWNEPFHESLYAPRGIASGGSADGSLRIRVAGQRIAPPLAARVFEVEATAHEERCSAASAVSSLLGISGRRHSV